MRSSWVRTGIAGAISLVAGIGFSACKNSLDFGTQGSHPCAFPGTACTIGGGGVGDSGPALKAGFVEPLSMTFDAAGNLYVADSGQNRIRKIDTNGVVTTIAGNGRSTNDFVPGRSGPDTTVPSPISVAVNGAGDVFWNDDRACGIYKLDAATQKVSIVAGGLGCAGSGGGEQQALGAHFSFGGCSKISLDSLGNLIVPDRYNYRVRYVNLSSAPVTAWGVSVDPGDAVSLGGNDSDVPLIDGGPATGSAIYRPCSAVAGPDGKLYVADGGHARIRVIDTNGIMDTVAGFGGFGGGGDGGLAVNAQFDEPEAVMFDAQGRLFVTDNTDRVRVINLSTTQPTTFAGVTISTGFIMTVAGGGSEFGLTSDGGAALEQSFDFTRSPAGAFDAAGNLYIGDTGQHVIRKVDATTGTMSVVAGFGGGGTADKFLLDPAGVARDASGNIFVSPRNRYLVRLDPSGAETVIAGNGSLTATGDGGPATNSGVWPIGLAVDKDGSVYFCDPVNHLVRRVDPDGTILTIAGNGGGGSNGDGGPAIDAGFDGPWGIALDDSSNLFVFSSERVRFINRNNSTRAIAGLSVIPGNIETIAGGNGGGFSGDGGPGYMAQIYTQIYNTDVAIGGVVDSKAGLLYFAEIGGNRIRKLDLASGIIDTVVGTGADTDDGVGEPIGLGLHGGYLYWTQRNGDFLKRVQLPYGLIETVAGDGASGYAGDGLTGSGIELLDPEGLTIDPSGVIYIADGSHHVRRVEP